MWFKPSVYSLLFTRRGLQCNIKQTMILLVHFRTSDLSQAYRISKIENFRILEFFGIFKDLENFQKRFESLFLKFHGICLL